MINISRHWPYKFILFSLTLAVAIFTIDNINHRFLLNDFRVYYYAAAALLKGQWVYGHSFWLDTGFYKYSPFALFLFIPFTILPYFSACIVQFFFVSFCFIGAVIIIRRIIISYLLPYKIKGENLLLIVINICVLLHVVREQELGNLNIILVLLLSTALLFTLKDRQGTAGFLLGLSIMLKPYFLLLLLPLFLHKKYRAVFFTVITVTATILAPALTLGIARSIELHQQWFEAMRQHNIYISSNHTIQSLIKNHTGLGSPVITYVIITLVLVGYLLMIWRMGNNVEVKNSDKGSKQLIFQYFILVAIIPNILVTDTEQFLYSLPLIIIVMSYLWVDEKKDYIMIAFFVLTILLFGSNSTDLLGKQLSDAVEYHGLLGLSNLFLIGLSIYLYFKTLSSSEPARHGASQD